MAQPVLLENSATLRSARMGCYANVGTKSCLVYCSNTAALRYYEEAVRKSTGRAFRAFTRLQFPAPANG